MKAAAIIIALGFALYWLNIGTQRDCESALRQRYAEQQRGEPTRADYRRECRNVA